MLLRQLMTKLTPMSLENDGSEENGGANRRRIHLREISGDTGKPAETVGQELRAARLRRGDEIAQVSRALKIRKDHLEALEEDRLEDLPGKTYAIGFVRSYARHLGLDAGQYVERFKQEISGRPDEQAREPAPIHQDDSRLPQGWRLIAGMVVVLLGVGVWHLLSSGGDANQPVPPAPVLNPPKVAAAPPPQPIIAPEQSATPSPAADSAPPADPSEQTATATPPPAAGPTTPAQAARAPTPAPAPAAPAGNAAPAAPPAQTATVAPAPATPAETAAPEGGRTYGQQNVSPRVVLRARADTRITVRGEDGTTYINRDLKAGDVYQVPNTPGLTMATTNGSAVEVNLDGVALGRAGPEQVLGRVSLDPQSLVDRFNRR